MMDFLISRLVYATERAAGRAAAPLALTLVIAVFAAIAYVSLLAGIFVVLAGVYGPALAWFALAGFHAVVAFALAIYLTVLIRRRKQRAKNAELAALALALAPRLMAKSPIGSLIAIGAAAYVIAKTRID